MTPINRANHKIASAFYQYILDEYNILWKDNKETVSWEEYRNKAIASPEQFNAFLALVKSNTKEIMELM